MSQLLVKYLPYILLLYFLICSFKKPIYLLGIPFLIFFRYCIFFENVKLFAIPESLTIDTLFLVWLIIIWIIYRGRSLIQPGYKQTNFYYYKGINWLDSIIGGLILISLIGWVIVQKGYIDTKYVTFEFITISSLFFGFFIIKSITCHTRMADLKDFLYSLVLVNTLASALYFLHQALHISIYKDPTDFEPFYFEGELILRTFWYMPVLWFFSIAYLIIFRKRNIFLTVVLLAINFLGIFISYTRSFMTIAFAMALLYFILIAYKKRNFGILIKNTVITCLAAVALFFTVSRALPGKFGYFMNRVNELKKNPNDKQSNDMIYRFANMNDAFHKMDANKHLIGLGSVTEEQLPWVRDMRNYTSDVVWIGVVFRWGYVGLGLFILLYFISIRKAFRLFIRNEGILSELGLLFLLIIISQVLESFVSWTFMNPNHFTLGLWYFGILSALTGFEKTNTFQIEKIDEV